MRVPAEALIVGLRGVKDPKSKVIKFSVQQLFIVVDCLFALPKNELPDFLNVGGRMVQRK